jgi:hypothetical protein
MTKTKPKAPANGTDSQRFRALFQRMAQFKLDMTTQMLVNKYPPTTKNVNSMKSTFPEE